MKEFSFSLTFFDLYLSSEGYFRLFCVNGRDLLGVYWSSEYGLEYLEFFGFSVYGRLE